MSEQILADNSSIMDDLKQCSGCKDWMNVNNFGPSRTGKNGLNPKCRKCSSKISYGHSAKPSYRYSQLKKMARVRKKGFSLTIQEYSYVILMDCFYCDGYFGKVKFSGGVDRIDNLKGYEFMNILPCCSVCNFARGNNFSVEETRLMIQTVIAIREKREVCL